MLCALALSFSACKKCYRCVNMCSVCHKDYTGTVADTNLTIQVCSDNLSTEYYHLYIDSLNALPSWECHDTAYTKVKQVCDGKSCIDKTILNETEAGWLCTEQQ